MTRCETRLFFNRKICDEFAFVCFQIQSSLNPQGHVLEKLELSHHDGVRLIFLITHLLTKAQLEKNEANQHQFENKQICMQI